MMWPVMMAHYFRTLTTRGVPLAPNEGPTDKGTWENICTVTVGDRPLVDGSQLQEQALSCRVGWVGRHVPQSVYTYI